MESQVGFLIASSFLLLVVMAPNLLAMASNGSNLNRWGPYGDDAKNYLSQHFAWILDWIPTFCLDPGLAARHGSKTALQPNVRCSR